MTAAEITAWVADARRRSPTYDTGCKCAVCLVGKLCDAAERGVKLAEAVALLNKEDGPKKHYPWSYWTELIAKDRRIAWEKAYDEVQALLKEYGL